MGRKKKDHNTISRKDLAKSISHLEGLTVTQSDRIIERLIKLILLNMHKGKVVELPSFGKLYGKFVPERTGTNPRTHEKITVEEKVQPKIEFFTSVKDKFKSNVDSFKEGSKRENGEEE